MKSLQLVRRHGENRPQVHTSQPCFRGMFHMELYFLWTGLRETLRGGGVFLDWGLNKFLLKLSGFCQHNEPLAKTAHLIPHTVILRRQWYFSLEEEKDGGTPEWLPKFGNHRDSTLALVPPNCSISSRNVANFPSQTGMLASLPCFVWVTEELLQPAKERLQSQVWVGGKRLGPQGLCLRNHHSYGYKENLCRDWGGGGTVNKEDGQSDSLLFHFYSDPSPDLIKHSLQFPAPKRKWSARPSSRAASSWPTTPMRNRQ